MVAGLFVVFYLVAPLVNSLWFLCVRPANFHAVQWSGTWQSESLSLISGRIVAKLPDTIPRDQAFSVEAMVYYNLWCPYRAGNCVPMKLAGYFGSESSGGGSSATPVIVPPQ